MELEYYSFRLLAKFPNFTDQAEKEEVTCPGPHAWAVRTETSVPFRWPQAHNPSTHHIASRGVVDCG